MLHVILIDDEPTVLEGMRYIFDKHMPEVKIVAALQNPNDIFPYLDEGNVELVFTDVKMPGMDGIELTEIIHTRYPHIYVVILSAFQDFGFVRSCLINGAFDYLLKPPSFKAIL